MMSAMQLAENNAAFIEGVCNEKPRRSLKSVRPLLPPKPKSLRKNSLNKAKVIAWVMIERYTPVTRERNANQPKASARRPGASATIAIAYGSQLNPHQASGSSFQFKNTMKSGRIGFA